MNRKIVTGASCLLVMCLILSCVASSLPFIPAKEARSGYLPAVQSTAKTLQPPPTIKLGAGISGELYRVDQTVNITWISSEGVPPLRVKLEYSTEVVAGSWVLIKDCLPAVGGWGWVVPNIAKKNGYIRATVTDSRNMTGCDINVEDFYVESSQKRGFLFGRVVDQKNISMPGVDVVINTASGKVTTHTGKNGSFWCELPPDTYEVELSKPGYKTNITCLSVAGLGEEKVVYVIILHPVDIAPMVLTVAVLFGLFITFVVVALVIVFRRKQADYRRRHPPREPQDETDEDEEEVERLWREDSGK
jgi:hypothetical protein